MIDTQAIRSKILDLAMRGQLTEQLPEDGTAEELYQQIQAEKQRLISEGKIKKEKPLPEIAEEEIPFDIPYNWKWVRWGDLSYQIQYGYNAPAKDKGRIRMVRITDIQGNKVIWDNVPYCDIDEDCIEVYKLKPNNILFARTGGTVGKSYLVENVDEEAVFAGYLIRTSFSGLLSAKYMKYFMDSHLYWKQLQNGTTAFAQPNCNAKTLSKMMLPLPPLVEQKRIIEKIEQAFSVLDTIDELQKQYADNLTALKSKLIDAAIQGKLTEQLPEDGTAEELYQQIQAEKQRLISEGKIKKEKPLPEISEEEIPFDIPDNWKWVRLNGISLKITDGTHHSPPNSSEGDYMYVTAKNIKESGVNLDNITFVSKDIHQEIYSRCNPEIGDVLLIKDGATTGVTTVNDIKEPFSMLSSVALIKTMPRIEPWYIVYALRSSWFYSYIRGEMTGVGITRVVLKQINSFIVPLPPLAEQKRIVQKLEEILPLCEKV